MRFIKPAMTIAAVCVAMLSLTIAVRRQQQPHGRKKRRPRG